MNYLRYAQVCICIFVVSMTSVPFLGAQLVTNDDCVDRTTVACGDPIIGDTNFAIYTGNYNGCYSENDSDVWYEIVGDDMIHTLQYVSSDAGRIEYHIQNRCNINSRPV